MGIQDSLWHQSPLSPAILTIMEVTEEAMRALVMTWKDGWDLLNAYYMPGTFFKYWLICSSLQLTGIYLCRLPYLKDKELEQNKMGELAQDCTARKWQGQDAAGGSVTPEHVLLTSMLYCLSEERSGTNPTNSHGTHSKVCLVSRLKAREYLNNP